MDVVTRFFDYRIGSGGSAPRYGLFGICIVVKFGFDVRLGNSDHGSVVKTPIMRFEVPERTAAIELAQAMTVREARAFCAGVMNADGEPLVINPVAHTIEVFERSEETAVEYEQRLDAWRQTRVGNPPTVQPALLWSGVFPDNFSNSERNFDAAASPTAPDR